MYKRNQSQNAASVFHQVSQLYIKKNIHQVSFTKCLLQCALCNEPLTTKVQHSLCRSCYKKEYQIKYLNSKRNATELDELPENSIVIPPYKRQTFDLNATTTSDDKLQSQSCSYDEGLIAACGAEHGSKQHHDLMKAVLQTSNLEPFGILLDHCAINDMATSRSVSTSTGNRLMKLTAL
ncbi:unnamed protein product [Absidia cylindrospora]